MVQKGTRYTLTLPPLLEQDLAQVTATLGVTKSEAIRRALALFKYAVQADKVELTDKSGTKEVLIK
ncbi:MAG: hypothetical protein O2968_02065 [Acidobacteria bacterium]|nr:hypothetical protein [Acidobacteriota bacterium]